MPYKDQNTARARAKRDKYRASSKGQATEAHYRLVRKYGITLEQFNAMLDAQGGVCKICEKVNENGRALNVDHDHATGKIRGLLCHRCNTAIGLLKDSAILVRAVVAYLLDTNLTSV